MSSRKLPEDWVVDSQSLVAAFFRTQRSQVHHWMDVEGMPRHEDKDGRVTYDLREIAQWRIRQAKARARDSIDETEAEAKRRKLDVDIRLKEEDIAKKRLEREEREGNLLARDTVVREIVAWAQKIRTSLTQLGDQIAAIVPGEMKGVTKQSVLEKVRITLLEAYTTDIGTQQLEDMILEDARRIMEKRGQTEGLPEFKGPRRKPKRGRGRPRKGESR